MRVILGTVIIGLILVALFCMVAPAHAVMFIGGTPAAGGGGGSIPVLESSQGTNGGASNIVSIDLAPPTGITADDFLVIVMGSDDVNAADIFDDDVSGFTFYGTQSDSSTHIALYAKVAAGTESTVTVSQAASSQLWGIYMRISGVNTAAPFDTVGFSFASDATSHTIPAITTSHDNELIIAGLSFDGGDATYAVSGTGWSKIEDEFAGTDPGNSSGTTAERDQASSGAGTDCIVGTTINNGATFFQLGIRSE